MVKLVKFMFVPNNLQASFYLVWSTGIFRQLGKSPNQ